MKKKSQDKPSQKVERNDSWQNIVTNLGTRKDKRTLATVYWDNRSPEEYEQFYTGDELMARIVNLVPEEALRKFIEWTGIEPEEKERVVQTCENLNFRGSLEIAWKLGRAYGGALQYIITDTKDPSSPLQPGETVLGLTELSRYDLIVQSSDVEADFAKKNFGKPNLYRLSFQMGVTSKTYPIHHSRVLRFDGYLLPRHTYIRNSYWHDSILNRLINSVRNYQTSNDAVASIIQDFNVGVYKMKNLANLLAAGQDSKVMKRMDMIAYGKSVVKMMVLDTDSEDFVDVARNVTGLQELVMQQANRLVAATDIPHTKLLGESPDGSSATGNSTTAQWYDYIQSQQENYLRPKMQYLLDLLFPDLKGRLGFKFKSLYQMTELEEAELRNKQAQTDSLYIEHGVLDPTEIAESRFGGESYSIETELDKEGRENGTVSPGSQNFGPPQDEPFGGENEGDTTDPSLNTSIHQTNPEAGNKMNPSPNGADIKVKKDADTTVDLPTMNPNVGTYAMHNQPLPGVKPKAEPTVSTTASLQMNDLNYGQYVKPAGSTPIPRIIAPTVGDGIVAPSGGASGDKDLEKIKSLKASLSQPLDQ